MKIFSSGRGLWKRWYQWHPAMRIETLALLVSLFFSLSCNGIFWKSAFSGRVLSQTDTWLFAAGLFVAITAIHYVLLCVFLTRWTVKPLLGLLILVTVLAAYYMGTFTVFLDPSMLRNVLRTDVKEAGELINVGLLVHLLLYAVVPLVLLFKVRVRHDRFGRAVFLRSASFVVALIMAAGSLFLVFQDLAPMMRNHKEIRYLITPGNYLYSLVKVLGEDVGSANRTRESIGLDATKGDGWTARTKPALFVIVVGETARTSNWGLSGYTRQTTPELAQLDVINFSRVTSCGTNTEVSVPCLFSSYGRRNYDETRIRNSESLLNVLTRVGFRVVWRDNQSGCKGVCAGVEEQKLGNSTVPEFCDGDRCLDEILLHGLDGLVADTKGNLVLVLHQLGNHGPAYFKRYPAAFRQFEPICETAELAQCSRQAIVNAYDNALLYTDHMLAQTIAYLKKQESRFDTAMIYVSDHGESLGENGLFLHGVPYAIAPKEQTEVPMVMWFSSGFAKDFSLDADCLRQRSSLPASHDNLFHSVLGLLDVRTGIYDPAMDVSAACRRH